MNRLPPRNRRLLSVVFIAVVHSLIPLIILNVFVVINQLQLIKRWNTENTLLLARLIIQRQERNLQDTRQLLTTLAELDAVRQHDVKECDRVFAGIRATSPLYANLGVADLNGNNWCSAVPMTEPISVKDRKHYQEAIKTKAFALGEYAIGRIVHEPVVHAAYPILDQNDNVEGVVLAAISLRWLNLMIASADLPEGSDAGIIDHQGTVLARHPDEESVGKKVTDEKIINALSEDSPQLTFDSSGTDNISRVYTLSRFPDPAGKEIYTFVGIPNSHLIEPAWEATKGNFLLTGIILILTFAIAFLDWKFFIAKVNLNHQSDSTAKKQSA